MTARPLTVREWIIKRPVRVVPSLGVWTGEGPRWWLILSADDRAVAHIDHELIATEIASALNREPPE